MQFFRLLNNMRHILCLHIARSIVAIYRIWDRSYPLFQQFPTLLPIS